MKPFLALPVLAALALLGPASAPARACGGFVEAPIPCDDPSPMAGAEYMLKRVGKALSADKARALAMFARGEGGFRTADTYVFCVGPDGAFSAHPNPILQGHDAMGLHDKTGNYFIKTMMETAKADQVQVIRYLFPKPGSTLAVPKTTFYAKETDQMCGVGVYDGDDGRPAKAASAQDRISQLRAKLDGEMPEAARADWMAFLEALNARSDEQASAMKQARERLKAVEVALSPDGAAQDGAANQN